MGKTREGMQQDSAVAGWLPRLLDMAEVVTLLGTMSTRLYRIVALVMSGAGLRISEAVKLQVGDIDAALYWFLVNRRALA